MAFPANRAHSIRAWCRPGWRGEPLACCWDSAESEIMRSRALEKLSIWIFAALALDSPEEEEIARAEAHQRHDQPDNGDHPAFPRA